MEALSTQEPSSEVIDLLIGKLKDENELVRLCTVVALGKLGAKNAVDNLVEMLEDEDQGVRIEVATALGKLGLGTKKAEEALIKMLSSEEDDAVRMYAAEALGEIGTKDAIEALEKSSSSDESELVQGTAKEVLEIIRGKH